MYGIETIGDLFDGSGAIPPLPPIDPSWIPGDASVVPPGYERKPDGTVGPIAPPSPATSSGPRIETLIAAGAAVVVVGTFVVLLLRR